MANPPPPYHHHDDGDGNDYDQAHLEKKLLKEFLEVRDLALFIVYYDSVDSKVCEPQRSSKSFH